MSLKVYNIKTDFGALGNGQKTNASLTIPTGGNAKVLSAPTAIFSGAVAGQCIGFSTNDISGGGTGTIFFGANNKIASVAGDGKSVTLTNSYTGTALVASTQSIEWGTDDTAAFTSFNTAAKAWMLANPSDTIELDIAGPGRFITGLCYPYQGVTPLNAICSAGAVISSCNGGVDGFPMEFGTVSQYQDSAHSTRVASVSAGATSVTVVPNAALSGATTIAAACGLFTSGQWALITGIDLQGGIGFPTNPQFFQFVLVTGINSTTGIISFSSPLLNDYKSTWPGYNTIGIDSGGPATLYAIDPQWNVTHTYTNVILDTPTSYSSSAGRSITFVNPTFISPSLSASSPYFANCGTFPSFTQSWNISGGNGGDFNMEVDKIIEGLTLTSFSISLIGFQSTSAKACTIDGCTVGVILGTPSNSTIQNSTITTLRIGAYAYGRTDTSVLFNNVIGAIQIGGPFYQGNSSEGLNNISGGSMAGGVITIPNAYITAAEGSISWAAPGAWISFCDHNQFGATPTFYRVSDMTQDATNTYVQTTAPGGFPTWAFNTVLAVQVHPCPDLTCTNCAASAPVTTDDGSYTYSLSQAAAHTPFTSWIKVNLVNATLAAADYWPLRGYIKTFKVTVNAAYTGTPAATIAPRPLVTGLYLDASDAGVAYNPTVNMKVSGARTLTVTGYPAVWGGAQSGDTLPSLTQPLWWGDSMFRNATDLSGDPGHPVSVTIELLTDQGITFSSNVSPAGNFNRNQGKITHHYSPGAWVYH